MFMYCREQAINELAERILLSLVANPARYEYIATQVREKSMSNKEATEKNINKAFLMSEQFFDKTWPVGEDEYV